MRDAKTLGFAVIILFALSLFAYLQPTSAQSVSSRAPAAPDPSGKSVTVANTPLPVTIDNPTVPVQQSGAWTVGLSGIPTVKVDPGSPVPVQVQVNDPAWQPFSGKADMTIQDGWSGGAAQFVVLGTDTPFTVPAGKRAVVEFVSLYAYVPIGQQLQHVVLGGVMGTHFIQLSATDYTPWQLSLVSASQEMKLYLQSGSTLTISVGRTTGTGEQNVMAYMTGHYVDLP